MSTLKTDKIVSPDGRTLLNSTGSVIQVVSAVKTDTFSTTASSYTAVTGLSASITPNSTSNKILVLVDFAAAVSSASYDRVEWALFRGATQIYLGDASGSAGQATGKFSYSDDTVQFRETCVFLDSPASTSSTTYQIYARDGNADGGTAYINQSRSTTASNGTLSASSIILMEVCG